MDKAALQQRLRLCFSKGESLKYISHLDLNRTWERVFRRAALPIAYSQGFNPRPRFQIAAALPVGVSGRAEYLDLWLTIALGPGEVRERLSQVLPTGLEVKSVNEVELRAASLQSQMRTADYVVKVESEEPIEALHTRVCAFLALSTLLRQRPHKGKLRTYDLRPLVHDVQVEPGTAGQHVLVIRMQASPEGAGRPDELLEALGLVLAPHTIERTNLGFEFDK
jgi:radical SAM-linked protein